VGWPDRELRDIVAELHADPHALARHEGLQEVVKHDREERAAQSVCPVR
jgi:hypothetical protein